MGVVWHCIQLTIRMLRSMVPPVRVGLSPVFPMEMAEKAAPICPRLACLRELYADHGVMDVEVLRNRFHQKAYATSGLNGLNGLKCS